MTIKENILKIKEDIELIRKNSLTNENIKLIAVTKTQSIESIQKVLDSEVYDIGENKVQELLDKYEKLPKDVKYHMIGNLQTNKVKYIIDKVSLIHSLDRLNLADEIDKRSKKLNKVTDCLIEVNAAKESTKSGIYLEEVERFIYDLQKFDNLCIKGFMTVAPFTQDKNSLRKTFRAMFELKEKIKEKNYEKCDINYLSMGMTNDYKIAIEEGSNMVRIGTAIFGKRIYK